MKRTQRLIVIVGDNALINSTSVRSIIAGFHACTIVKHISQETLANVFHFNKNAVVFNTFYDFLSWKDFNPVVVRLSYGDSSIEKNILGANNIISDFPKILEKYDVDVGDHESHDSSGVDITKTDNCLLCKIIEGRSDKPEHIVFATDHFYMVPGTGAFFDGYLMIVPKRHVMSFALLTAEELSEFFDLLDDIRPILEAIYHKKIFAFECGSGRTGDGKHETSIVHAHFHLAPTDMPVLREVQKSGLYPALISKEELVNYGEYPYMLYVDQEDNWYICSKPEQYYPRQHPRQVLANYMGCYDIYNWRIHPFREKMDIIAEEFRTFCYENRNLLPTWILESVRFED